MTTTAGRKMDALIAENVMGWVDIKPSVLGDYFVGTWPETGICEALPQYSTSIAAAWQVVEKLWDNHEYRLDLAFGGDEHRIWIAELAYDANHLGPAHHKLYDRKWRATADTAPLAICLVALTAVPRRTPVSHISESGR